MINVSQLCSQTHPPTPPSITAKAIREVVTLLRSEKSRGLLCPAVGHSGLLLSFEQILGLFIIEHQSRRAFGAMKEFIIRHPTCFPLSSRLPLRPDILPHSQQALRLAGASGHLGWPAATFPPDCSRSPESQTTLNAHTYPSDWDGSSKGENGQLRRKLHKTDLLQAYLSGGLQSRDRNGRHWEGLGGSSVLSPPT